ncbi:MAG: hypothetical protein Q9174_003174, partial [Haloplaca sp. 1 TL-2023]
PFTPLPSDEVDAPAQIREPESEAVQLSVDSLSRRGPDATMDLSQTLVRSVDYYYIDFHASIDAVKYRVLQLTTRVKQMFKPSQERKDFFCPRCKAHWALLEVVDNTGLTGFLCHRCGGLLEQEERTTGEDTGSEKQVKLAAQLEPLLKLLKEIDNTTVPPNNFETAMERHIPVQRDADVNPVRPTVPVQAVADTPTGVKGISQPVLQDLTVDFTSTADRTPAERAEQERNATIAAQNALPVWHTQSTVKATLSPDAQNRVGSNGNPTASPKFEASPEDDKIATLTNLDDSDELAAYYRRMAQEKEKEAREDREAESSSEDEDEQGDLEDVSTDPTPFGTPVKLTKETNGNLKRPMGGRSKANDATSDSGSSAPGSRVVTPDMESHGGRADAKRSKLVTAQPDDSATTNLAISDEDEEAEFVNAL